MSDLRSLLRAAAAARRDGRPLLVATVVGVRGSSYRRAGARMILDEERWLAGFVSGGCVEADLARRGWWLLRGARAALVTYDSNADDDTPFGLGCGGTVDILLERLEPTDPVDPFRFMEGCVDTQRAGVIATVVQSDDEGVPLGSRVHLHESTHVVATVDDHDLLDGVVRDRDDVLRAGQPIVATYATGGGTVRVLLEPIVPPPRLFVLGTGHDAASLVSQARALGWEVLVWVGTARFSAHERFTGADAVLLGDARALQEHIDRSARPACVVMNHQHERDRAALRAALASRAHYVGVLGPRRRTERMLDELGMMGAWDDPRLHAPVGLELGAESPAEIALSIIAEVQSVLTGASAASLRERSAPIHVGLAS